MLRRFDHRADGEYGRGMSNRKAERQFVARVDLVGYEHVSAMMSAAAVINAPAPNAMINQSN